VLGDFIYLISSRGISPIRLIDRDRQSALAPAVESTRFYHRRQVISS
jgi:hypothetical protein